MQRRKYKKRHGSRVLYLHFFSSALLWERHDTNHSTTRVRTLRLSKGIHSHTPSSILSHQFWLGQHYSDLPSARSGSQWHPLSVARLDWH